MTNTYGQYEKYTRGHNGNKHAAIAATSRVSTGKTRRKTYHKTCKFPTLVAFVLAVAVTSAGGVWVLERHGGALHQAICSLANRVQHSYSQNEESAGGEQEVANGHTRNISTIYQNPELKNGCEATSLAILLSGYGYSIDKSTLAYQYIPREDFVTASGVHYGPDPNVAYAGDPATTKGFYCFANPIISGANQFLSEQASSLHAQDISGATVDELAQYIRNGAPVMVWVTLDYGTVLTGLDFTWALPDGSTYKPYQNLHCVVLYGVNEQSFYVSDPLNGQVVVDKNQLLTSNQAVGGYAVTIL